MAKTARLDQILLQLRLTDEEQITRALRRQKSHGGRLGMNLVQLGAITEEQLLMGLAEQFRVPTMEPKEGDIPPDLVERMPRDIVSDGVAVPLAWNEGARVLSLAVANPDDTVSLRRVREAFDAKAMRVALAPEGLLAALGRRLAPVLPEPVVEEGEHRVRLPELFAVEAKPASTPDPTPESAPGQRTVVMITAHASRKNFLPPVFEREGFALSVVSTRDEVADALANPRLHRVLLSDEMSADFAKWKEQGLVPPKTDVVSFGNVADALLENPLQYAEMVRSLRSAVQALADYRSGELGVSPPYGLMATDIQALAGRLRMSRVATDALHLAGHLLLPPRTPQVPGSGVPMEPFGAFASSLELATRIRFPWSLDALLAACHRLYSGHADPSDPVGLTAETHLAAQILSLTWYRHNHVPAVAGTDEERMMALRSALRSMGGRLATQGLIEEYLALITERGGVEEDVGDRQVLLVGDERISRSLSPALARVGRETVATGDLADAQTMAERRTPGAIVLDHAAFPTHVDKFTRVTKLGGGALLFVLTDSTDPALVLNLLDVGVDDVFGPPHDYDLVAARINRAIRSRSRMGAADRAQAGQFSASFDVFGFLDLVQMLSQGMKSVRIDLSNGPSRAVILMQKGRMVHAEAGGHVGPEAVYAVIRWEDEGDFVVKEENTFPETTIVVPSESVLMEGLRLLDESKRGQLRA
jgi:hypothetical protein